MENFANSFRTALVGAIDDADTSISVLSVTGAPAADFRIRVDDELMLVTSVGGTLDPDFIALLNFDGSDASTTITDEIGDIAWTCYGNAQLDTAQAKFGPSSLLLDGTTDAVESDTQYAFTTAESWTVQGWARPENLSIRALVHIAPADNYGVLYYINTSTQMRLMLSDNGSSHNLANDVGLTVDTISTATWYHWAVEYDATNDQFSIYWNGNRIGQYSSTVGFNESKTIRIGAWTSSRSIGFNGWMDTVVFTRRAEYGGAASYAIPTEPPDPTAASVPLTVTRGIEDTTAAAHDDEALVTHVLTAGGLAQWIADRYTPL